MGCIVVLSNPVVQSVYQFIRYLMFLDSRKGIAWTEDEHRLTFVTFVSADCK
jgi:hypothetical protein